MRLMPEKVSTFAEVKLSLPFHKSGPGYIDLNPECLEGGLGGASAPGAGATA